jgi:hypothetical protein
VLFAFAFYCSRSDYFSLGSCLLVSSFLAGKIKSSFFSLGSCLLVSSFLAGKIESSFLALDFSGGFLFSAPVHFG